MKTILIVYNTLSIGGSTTSLLSLLNEIDYTKYNVDLLLPREGEYNSLIPKSVNVLPYLIPSNKYLIFKKITSIKSILNLVKALYYDKILKRPNVRSQIMSLDTIRFYKPQTKEYDVAISFIENFPLYYTISKVKAQKYITWIHVDYIGAKLNVNIDKKYINKFNNIVLVSNSCKESFNKCFPFLSNHSVTIENLLSSKLVIQRSLEPINYTLPNIKAKHLKFVSTCRIVFCHKGLDRGVKALAQLKKEGLLRKDFVWYIIGDGKDYNKLNSMISSANLTDVIYLCGAHKNPLPLIKQCDVFFLPSRYEGKPMAVTEAQMLGLIPIVTEYASAKEQIINNKNGIILPNEDASVYTFFKEIMISDSLIWDIKPNVQSYNYSNIQEYKKIEILIDK